MMNIVLFESFKSTLRKLIMKMFAFAFVIIFITKLKFPPHRSLIPIYAVNWVTFKESGFSVCAPMVPKPDMMWYEIYDHHFFSSLRFFYVKMVISKIGGGDMHILLGPISWIWQ